MTKRIEEAQLREIWEEMLGRPLDEADPSFFEAGGDSIMALNVIFRIEEAFGVSLDVADLFDAPTLGQFARRVNVAAGRA